MTHGGGTLSPTSGLPDERERNGCKDTSPEFDTEDNDDAKDLVLTLTVLATGRQSPLPWLA